MKNKMFLLTASLLMSLLFPLRPFASGGMDGGGGLSVRANKASPLILWDLLTHSPSFTDSYQDENQLKFRIERPWNRSDIVGIKMVDWANMPSFQLAKLKLEQWALSSPIMVSLIREALNTMHSLYVDSHFFPTVESSNPEKASLIKRKFPEASVKYAARYGCPSQLCGSIYSAPLFNQLGRTSQAALIIHEALRHLQSEFPGTFASDETIELITAKIILDYPGAQESLDQAQYLGQNLSLLLSTPNSSVTKYHSHICAQLAQIKTQCQEQDKSFPLPLDLICSEGRYQYKTNLELVETFYLRVDMYFESMLSCDMPKAKDIFSESRQYYWKYIAAKLEKNHLELNALIRNVGLKLKPKQDLFR